MYEIGGPYPSRRRLRAFPTWRGPTANRRVTHGRSGRTEPTEPPAHPPMAVEQPLRRTDLCGTGRSQDTRGGGPRSYGLGAARVVARGCLGQAQTPPRLGRGRRSVIRLTCPSSKINVAFAVVLPPRAEHMSSRVIGPLQLRWEGIFARAIDRTRMSTAGPVQAAGCAHPCGRNSWTTLGVSRSFGASPSDDARGSPTTKSAATSGPATSAANTCMNLLWRRAVRPVGFAPCPCLSRSS